MCFTCFMFFFFFFVFSFFFFFCSLQNDRQFVMLNVNVFAVALVLDALTPYMFLRRHQKVFCANHLCCTLFLLLISSKKQKKKKNKTVFQRSAAASIAVAKKKIVQTNHSKNKNKKKKQKKRKEKAVMLYQNYQLTKHTSIHIYKPAISTHPLALCLKKNSLKLSYSLSYNQAK